MLGDRDVDRRLNKVCRMLGDRDVASLAAAR